MEKDQFLLFEHPVGFELFKLKQYEDITMQSYMDYMALMEVIEHVSSFKSNFTIYNLTEASEKEQEKILEQLKNFLLVNNVKVLHCDKSLKSFVENLKIEHKVSFNITRGIRRNLSKILKKEIDNREIFKAAMEFSKIKIGELRKDNYVVHVGYELEQVEKEISMIQESLSKYNSTEFLSESDLFEKEKMTEMLAKKMDFYEKFKRHFEGVMKEVVPNTRNIVGDKILFKMLHKAGSLTNLAMAPASTIQLYGAEKALFSALKNRKNTPKYGFLYDLVDSRDKKVNKGLMSRFIANKCAIAAKIDCFDNSTDKYGIEMRKLIDQKFLNNKKQTETTEDLLERVYQQIQQETK